MQYSQKYPSWFLNRPETNGNYFCGMVENEYDLDSSFVSAAKDASIRAAISKHSTLILEDVFHSAGGQNSWMETTKIIKFDTLLAQTYFDSYSVIDSFQTNKFTFSLISSRNSYINGFLIDVGDISQPHWVENIPKNNEFNYSVGVSESYYYITESWKNAEENGRIDLAHELFSKSRQIQKKLDYDYTDIVEEIVETTLDNVEVVARWVDNATRLHYVLLRIPKV